MLYEWEIPVDISIHAPREGGDVDKETVVNSILLISIHAPREGGDIMFI